MTPLPAESVPRRAAAFGEKVLADLFPPLHRWYSTDAGKKKVRYFLTSVITTILSQVVLFALNFGKVVSATEASVIATAAGAIPSYYLNRAWAWGKSGKSSVAREVLPFWVLAFVGLFVSLGAVAFSDHEAKAAAIPHLATSVVDNAAYLLAFVVVWVGKYIVFDKFVFIHHSHHRQVEGEAVAEMALAEAESSSPVKPAG